MKQHFYSNGKLLISGEYLVLDGAKSLAVPTTYGQSLEVEILPEKQLKWQSFNHEGACWLDLTFTWEVNEQKAADSTSKESLLFSSSSSQPEAQVLVKAFNWIAQFQPQLFVTHGYSFTSKLSFPNNWGLGSSSTFVNNLALWSTTDAFALQELLFGGSGYDVACAQHDTSILFQRSFPEHLVEEVDFLPSFADELFFVHLNQKKNSREAIRYYRAQTALFIEDAVLRINDITQQMLRANTITNFEKLMKSHEKIIATLLQTPPIKQELFADYTRQIKSLGGWGGDFVLATGGEKQKDYFISKGFSTIVDYRDMVLSNK